MTFGVTCVVDNIVRTHFRNVAVGMASGAILSTGEALGVQFSAFRRVSVVSNQKRQVNYNAISMAVLRSGWIFHTCAANSPILLPFTGGVVCTLECIDSLRGTTS